METPPTKNDNQLSLMLTAAIQEILTEFASNRIIGSLAPEINNAYQRLNPEKRFRLLIGMESNFVVVKDIFMKYFPVLGNLPTKYSQDSARIIRNVIYACQPWLPDYPQIIVNIINNNPRDIQAFIRLIDEATELSRLTQQGFASYTAFYVFGCPTSTDIDIALVVEHEEFLQREFDIDSLKSELQKIGYDVTRILDINPVMIDHNGNIAKLYKGNIRETQNIIYHTYQYHRQIYPCAIQRDLAIDITDKIRSITKFTLDYMEHLLCHDEYLVERDRRRAAYISGDRLPFCLHLMEKIHYIDTHEWRDAIKSLTMKIVQLILWQHGISEYTKPGLAAKFTHYYPLHADGIAWLLNRGRQGRYNIECLQLLFNEFERIADQNSTQIQWQELPIDFTQNPTILSNHLVQEFLRSPLEPTADFITGFSQVCPDRSINNVFIIECRNTHHLPPEVLVRSVLVAQRSPAWLRYLQHYSCGRNSGVVAYNGDDWVKFYYNLIRGSIIEMFVMRCADFSVIAGDVKAATVGMLVKDRSQSGSVAIAPDLILVDKNGCIIPVEIKCIPEPPGNNHDYRRAIKLAKCQIQTCFDVLDITQPDRRRGIIVIVNVYQTNGENIIAARAGFVNV